MKVAQLRIIVAVCAASLAAYACSETSPTAVAPRTVSESVVGGVNAFGLPDGSGPLIQHDGTVLPFTHTYAMFWGTSWNTDATFTGDRITSMNAFLDGFGGSTYANNLTEYGVGTQSTHVTTIVDNIPAPPSDPGGDGLGNFACNLLGAHGYTPDFNAVYIVYATTPPSGSAAGYHTNYSCRNIRIHTVMVFQTSNALPPGALPPLYHSVAATTMASITAHELAETITDEYVGHGWFAAPSGIGEIADKCDKLSGSYVTLHNGSTFLLPLLWSNSAFARGTGQANWQGEKGCVSTSSAPWPTVTVTGPTFTHQFQPATFSVSIAGGTAPFTYYWYFSSSTPTFVLPSGTSQSFTSTQYGAPNGTTLTVFCFVTDAAGRSGTGHLNITPGY